MEVVSPDNSRQDDYESDDGEFFLEDDDIIQEIPIDEEELPEQDDEEMDPDVLIDQVHQIRLQEVADDSFYVFNGHTDELYSVTCSPTDASLVATGGKDDKGFMWRVGSQDFGLELNGHGNTVSTLAFSSDGQLLATGSFDGLIQVWDVMSNRFKYKLEGSGGGIEWLKWHPKGHLILAGSEDFSVWLWNADKGVYLNTFNGHARSVTCGDFTPDGKIICTGSDDASLRIWNPKTTESINVKGHSYHTEGLTCLSITHDSTITITGSRDGSVYMVNIATGRVIGSLDCHSDSVECIGQSPSSHLVATGSLDQWLTIWDITHTSHRWTLEHADGVTCLLWLGMSQFIATGSIDGKVRIWDSLSGICVQTFNGHLDVVQSLAVTADQNSLVSVSNDGTARVFVISNFSEDKADLLKLRSGSNVLWSE